jgi:AcrR family transcriptional regulator
MASRKKSGVAAVATRAARSDGDTTRAQLLATAGLVFAEQGYARATSKEICARAGANPAAVNYHFGSKDTLYEAVLLEAHRNLVDIDELKRWTTEGADPRERLRVALTHFMSLASSHESAWGYRVLLRELLSPSPLLPVLVSKGIRPKARLMVDLIAEVTGLPPDHPTLQRCLFFSVVPCIVMALAPPQFTAQLYPAVNREAASMPDELVKYVLGGLDAIARTAATGASAKRDRRKAAA